LPQDVGNWRIQATQYLINNAFRIVNKYIGEILIILILFLVIILLNINKEMYQ
jgi:hypothetical protein